MLSVVLSVTNELMITGKDFKENKVVSYCYLHLVLVSRIMTDKDFKENKDVLITDTTRTQQGSLILDKDFKENKVFVTCYAL